MKYTLPLLILATPAVAHPGGHIHPHGLELWVAAATLLLYGVGRLVQAKVRAK